MERRKKLMDSDQETIDSFVQAWEALSLSQKKNPNKTKQTTKKKKKNKTKKSKEKNKNKAKKTFYEGRILQDGNKNDDRRNEGNRRRKDEKVVWERTGKGEETQVQLASDAPCSLHGVDVTDVRVYKKK